MNYYLQDATMKKMYNTSNDNLPLVYGHVYKTLKLNTNNVAIFQCKPCISNAIVYSLIVFTRFNLEYYFKI